MWWFPQKELSRASFVKSKPHEMMAVLIFQKFPHLSGMYFTSSD